MSKTTYKTLVEDTFMVRRTFIKETARSSAEVLDMCPYLGKQEHVSDTVFEKSTKTIKLKNNHCLSHLSQLSHVLQYKP